MFLFFYFSHLFRNFVPRNYGFYDKLGELRQKRCRKGGSTVGGETDALRDYRNSGILPYIRLKGNIVYKESDIEKVLSRHYIRS